MGPTTYALCQKPIIGVVMWVSSLCVFPPLFTDASISLEMAGAAVSREFTVPVDKRYPFIARFTFPTVEDRIKDEVVGSRFDQYCDGSTKLADIPEQRRKGLGQPMPFRIVVKRKTDQATIFDQTFESLCVTGHIDNTKIRTIGWVDLRQGEYTADIILLESQPGLSGVKATVSLVAGSRK